jgi:hypothetical protein
MCLRKKKRLPNASYVLQTDLLLPSEFPELPKNAFKSLQRQKVLHCLQSTVHSSAKLCETKCIAEFFRFRVP